MVSSNNPIRDLPVYCRIFRTYLARRMYLIFALSLVADLAEGAAILMLLPLLKTLGGLGFESERAIQERIDELKGQITVVIIAYRLSTIRDVDQVYVFD